MRSFIIVILLTFKTFSIATEDVSTSDNHEPKQTFCNSKITAMWLTSSLSSCIVSQSTVINATGFKVDIEANEAFTTIDFSFNENIYFLPENISEKMPNLIDYKADHCSVEVISRVNFLNLHKLMNILLSSNQISSIASGTFENLKALKRIELEKNKISFLNFDVFEGLGALKTVLLNGNLCINEDFLDEVKLVAMPDIIDSKCGYQEASVTQSAEIENTFDMLNILETFLSKTVQEKEICLEKNEDLEFEIRAAKDYCAQLETHLKQLEIRSNAFEAQLGNVLDQLELKNAETNDKNEKIKRLEEEMKKTLNQ